MSKFWQETLKASVLKKNRKSITIPAFAIRCGELNRSVYFKQRDTQSGLTHAVSGANYSLKSAFTFECWLKTWGSFYDGVGGLIFANHRNVQNDNSIEVSLFEEKVVVGLLKSSAQSLLTSASRYPQGEWFHLAVTYDGATCKIYINGVLDANTLSLAADLDAGTGNTYTYLFGNNLSSGTDVPYVGYMGEMRVWKDDLTREQIQENMFFRTGKKLNLMAYYKVNEIGSAEGNFPELIGGTNITVSWSITNNGLERVTTEYPPIITGASLLAARFDIEGEHLVSLKFPARKPSDVNFMLCVSYVDDDVVVRYRLWDCEGVSIAPSPERYRGQQLPATFSFEIWARDGEDDCTLEDDYILHVSKVTIPASMTDEESEEFVNEPEINQSIFAPLPATFPIEFTDNQYGTVADPEALPGGEYEASTAVYGNIQ